MTGRTLLHYDILERIGEGGMGVVYKARDTHLDRFVAIKVLPPDKTSDPERRARFAREAKAASSLRHPSIVTIYDIARDGDHDFIVMEYVPGRTLDVLIGRHGLKLNDAVRYGTQIADALARAHAAGIVHRDLKPANIMVDEHEVVRILDFGLAKLTENLPGEEGPTLTLRPKTEEGTIVGTVSYMSPEQAEGKPVDARSDVFSFGAVLYEMLCGRRAFAGDSRVSTLAAILNRDPVPLGQHIPRELERIVTRCLRKDAERRWHSIADVKVALQDIKDESESGSLAVAPAATRLRRRWAVVAIAGVLGAGAAGAWIWQNRHDQAASDAVLRPSPLTTYEGWQVMPTFSPDGSQVAFAWCKSNSFDDTGSSEGCSIYVKQIGEEEPERLSKAPDNAAWPKWSPDGAYIAFSREIQEPQHRIQYVVVPQRGRTEKVVADFPASDSLRIVAPSGGIAWTPDSKTLIVAGAEKEHGYSVLYAVPLEGGTVHRVLDKPPTVADSDPAISPDGRWLAFTRETAQLQSEVYVSPLTPAATAGAPVRLNSPAGAASLFPAWMPNSREVVFVSAAGFRTELYRVGVDHNARPQRMSLAHDNVLWPDVGPRGRFAYANGVLGDANIFRIVAGEGAAWGAPEKFISSTMMELEPQFSPDGKKVAVTSARSGTEQIWVFDSDGSNPVALSPGFRDGQVRPRWSPDGRTIAFYGGTTNTDVYTVDANSGAVRRVTDQPGRDGEPEWSCDSKYLYINSDRGHPGEAWRIPVSGGTGERTEFAAQETWDCKWLIYLTGYPNHVAVWRKPLSGGRQPELLADPLHPNVGFQVFPDGIYYVSSKRTTRGFPILFRSTTDGRVRELAAVPRPFWGLTVSPDRRTILFAALEGGHSNLMLVEGFR